MKTKLFILMLLVTAGLSHTGLNASIYSDETISSGSYDNIVIHDSLDIPPIHTTVDMTGGEVIFMRLYDTSTLNFSGGIISLLSSFDSSTVNLSGGTVGMIDSTPGTFNVIGYGFDITPLTGTNDSLLTGYWGDSDPFSTRLRRWQTSPVDLVFHEVPEPTSILLFGLTGLLIRRISQ